MKKKKEINQPLNYWEPNSGSRFLRLVVRIILRSNASGILAGDLGQIRHLSKLTEQTEARKLVKCSHLQRGLDDTDRLSVEASACQYIFKMRNTRVHILPGLTVLDAGFVIDSKLAPWQKLIYRDGIGSSIKRTHVTLDGSFKVTSPLHFNYHAVIDELPNPIRIRAELSDCNSVIISSLAPRRVSKLLEYFKLNTYLMSEKALSVKQLFALSATREVAKRNSNRYRENFETQKREIVRVLSKETPRSSDQIEKSLVEQNFGLKLTKPGKLFTEQQIQEFSSAKIVIDLYCDALTNNVWMNNSSYMIEILNHVYRTSDYQRFYVELGIGYSEFEIENLSAGEVASIVQKVDK